MHIFSCISEIRAVLAIGCEMSACEVDHGVFRGSWVDYGGLWRIMGFLPGFDVGASHGVSPTYYLWKVCRVRGVWEGIKGENKGALSSGILE